MSPLETYLAMIEDRRRVDAYRAAIEATVRPGDVVLDLGCGTGLFSIFAARAGARKVYAVEQGPIAQVATEVVRANGLEETVEVLRGHSTEIAPPERADVLVADALGQFGVDSRLATRLADARERWLVPGARLVPRRLELWIAPVRWPGLIGRMQEAGRRLGVRLEMLDDLARSTVGSIDAGDVRVEVGHRRFGDAIELGILHAGSTSRVAARWESAEEAGLEEAHGLAGGFRAELADGICLDHSPQGGLVWSLPIFPFDRSHPTARMDAWVEHRDASGHAWGVRSSGGSETRAAALGFAPRDHRPT